MSTPATDLLKALSAGLADGTFSRDEAQEVLEVCAELMEALADQHVKRFEKQLTKLSIPTGTTDAAPVGSIRLRRDVSLRLRRLLGSPYPSGRAHPRAHSHAGAKRA